LPGLCQPRPLSLADLRSPRDLPLVNYADTSFLVSLYFTDVHSTSARDEAARMKQPLALTALHRIELRNAFNFAINRSRIDSAQRDALWKAIEADLAGGFLVEATPSTSAVFRRAETLSDSYTPNHALRSLDLLHIAAACELEAGDFFTFDQKQRIAALAEGLTVKPKESG
jgi:predicted nucleic acid-binding protein